MARAERWFQRHLPDVKTQQARTKEITWGVKEIELEKQEIAKRLKELK